MKKVVIESPVGIPNKEKYLAESLAVTKNREICSIEKQKDGKIVLLLGGQVVSTKYFAKVIKKKEFETKADFMENFENALQEKASKKNPDMLKCMVYEDFFVLIFRK